MTFYVRIVYDVPDGEVVEHIGPMDRYLAEIVCLSMADGYQGHHVKRAKVVEA